MLTIYRAGLISWSKNLQIAVMSALTAILMIYLISFIGVFLGFEVPYIHEASPIGILFSVFVICIASLCLVADFDFIERGVERGAPKQLEWRAVRPHGNSHLAILGDTRASRKGGLKEIGHGPLSNLSLAVAGLALGVVEGVKPGPLLTMVIKETLSGGFRAGMWTARLPYLPMGHS